MSNPSDLSALPFPGGPVDASGFQPRKGPTSHAVPMVVDAIDVTLFESIANASRVATIEARLYELEEDLIPTAEDANFTGWLSALWEERCALIAEREAFDAPMFELRLRTEERGGR